VADEVGIRHWSAGAAFHTDDHPILEFTTGRRLGSNLAGPLRAELVEAGVKAGPIRLGSAGMVGGAEFHAPP
jgi:hypothetical protein